MKKLFIKHKEIIMYLIFGVLTTIVGMGTYFLVLFAARSVGVSETSGAYNAVRVAAQIIQWVLAVLFAYYTNKKWVFDAASTEHEKTRLASFFGARLFSLGCDSLVTFGTVFALTKAGYKSFLLALPLGVKLAFTPDLWAKLAAAVVVVVVNYILSKFFVFRKSKGAD